MAVAAYVRNAPGPILPPPLARRGAIGWLRANLFSSRWSTAVTLLTRRVLPVDAARSDRLGDDARGVERSRRRALPRPSGRRLLGLRRRTSSTISVTALIRRPNGGGSTSSRASAPC